MPTYIGVTKPGMNVAGATRTRTRTYPPVRVPFLTGGGSPPSVPTTGQLWPR